MSPAKTNAERQADLKARRVAAGLVSLKNVWVHPDDVAEMRAHAAKLQKRRERAAAAEARAYHQAQAVKGKKCTE